MWAPDEASWFGEGTLMVSRPGEAHSIWLFWTPNGTFDGWYVNLEEPRRRTRDGVLTRDQFLDLVVEQTAAGAGRTRTTCRRRSPAA